MYFSSALGEFSPWIMDFMFHYAANLLCLLLLHLQSLVCSCLVYPLPHPNRRILFGFLGDGMYVAPTQKQTKKSNHVARLLCTLKYTVFNGKSHACQCFPPIPGARSRFADMYALTRTQIGFLLDIPRSWLICSLATGPLLVPDFVNVARPGTRRRDCRIHEAAHGSPGVLEREVCRRRKLVVSLVEQSGVYVSSGLQTSGDVWYYVLTPRFHLLLQSCRLVRLGVRRTAAGAVVLEERHYLWVVRGRVPISSARVATHLLHWGVSTAETWQTLLFHPH